MSHHSPNLLVSENQGFGTILISFFSCLFGDSPEVSMSQNVSGGEGESGPGAGGGNEQRKPKKNTSLPDIFFQENGLLCYLSSLPHHSP